jgi:hypothetical protein
MRLFGLGNLTTLWRFVLKRQIHGTYRPTPCTRKQTKLCKYTENFLMFSHVTNSNPLRSLPPPSQSAHYVEEFLLSSCSMYGEITALFLLTA